MDDRIKSPFPPIRSRRQSVRLGSPHAKEPDVLGSVLTTFESIFLRLERSIENQSLRLRSIEHNLADIIAGKFDTLISVNVKVNENIIRLVENAGLIERSFTGKHSQPNNPQKHIENYASFLPDSTFNLQLNHVDQMSDLVKKLAIADKKHHKKIPAIQENIKESHKEPVHSGTNQIVQSSFMNTPSIATSIVRQHHVRRPAFSQTNEVHKYFTSVPQSLGLVTACGDIQAFIKRVMGEFSSDLTERMYQKYSQGKMTFNELKAEFSWNIMQFSLIFDRYFRRGAQLNDCRLNHNSQIEASNLIDRSVRIILEYLINKYPPSKHKIVDTQLAKHITEIKRQNDLSYDVLKNAGMSFVDNTGKTDFTREIKVWINRLVLEVKSAYPKFKTHMKELFLGRDTSSLETNQEMEYEIGTKISETIDIYTDQQLDQPGLSVKSPQISRVMVKWIEQMRRVFLSARQVINGNKTGFKSITGGAAIYLTSARKEQLVRKLNEIMLVKLTPLGLQCRKRLLISIGEVFNLVQSGFEDCDELNQEQIICLKTAQYLSELNQMYMLRILNNTLTHLNSIRKSYKEDLLEANIDLVSFNVLDILRCKCIGYKKDIKRIYNSLVQNPNYQIIRVKNKLNESTRDILINFKVKSSFLICEMQLALGDSKDAINDHFCHYLYELHRSIFPVMFEVAGQLVSHDSRMTYFAGDSHPLQWRHTEQHEELKQALKFSDNRMYCGWRHNSTEMAFEENNIPFCCSLCSRFVGAFQYRLEFLRCPECGISICPKCILSQKEQMQSSYLVRYVNCKKIQKFMVEKGRVICEFSTQKQLLPKIKSFLPKSSDYVILKLFCKTGIKSLIAKKCNDYVVETFFTLGGRELVFADDKYESWNSIIIPRTPQLYKISELTEYVKVLIDDTPWHELEQSLRLKNIDSVIGIKDDKMILVIDIVESEHTILQKLTKQHIANSVRVENQKAEATIQLTSKELTDLSVLSEIKNPSNVRSLNFWDNKIATLPDFSAFNNLTQIVLRQNLLISAGNLYQMKSLRLLNLPRNLLSGKLPLLDLPNLLNLNISFNHFTDITSLSQASFPHLHTLYVSSNEFTQLPVLSCPKLEIYFFPNNSLSSLQSLIKSDIPKVTILRGHNNKISGALPILMFSELKQLHLNENSITDISNLSQSNLPCLEKLDLSKNSISCDVPQLTMPTLQFINLNTNKIQRVNAMGGWQMPMINEIDLSSNSISDSLPILNLPTLKLLQMSHNNIGDISQLNESRLDNLERLILTSNEIKSIPMLRLFHLKYLDLSGNKIQSAQVLKQCRLPMIEKLNLADNLITGIIPALQMPYLTDLTLDRNFISELEFLKERCFTPWIRYISIKQNPKLSSRVDFLVFDETQMDVYSNSFIKRPPDRQKRTFFQD